MWTRTGPCWSLASRTAWRGQPSKPLAAGLPAPGHLQAVEHPGGDRPQGQGCPGGVCGGHQPARVPREIPGTDGVRRVVCQDPAEDTGVLRQMRRLLLDEEPRQAAGPGGPGDSVPSAASASSETRAQGAEPAARKAGPLRGGAAGGAETEAEAAGGPRGAGRPSGEGGPRTPGGSRTPRTPLPRAAWGSCCRGRSRATRARAPPRLRARCPPRCTRPPRS